MMKKPSRWLIVLLGAALILTGCGTDRASDAARGRQQDAERESVIGADQATYTWNLLYGTPEASPSLEP